MLKVLLILIFSFVCYCQETPKLQVFVGIGYDVVAGNPKTNRMNGGFKKFIFHITYNDGKTTDDGNFLVPDKMNTVKLPPCSNAYTATTQQFTGTKIYHESLKNLVNISTSFNPWLVEKSFTGSTEFNAMNESTIQSDSMVFDSEAKCEVYELEMDLFDTPPLSDGFKNAILMASETPNDQNIWFDIIKNYGTHYVIRSNYGGRMHLQSRLKRRGVQELTAMDFNVRFAAGLFFKKFIGNIDSEVKSNTRQINTFEKRVEETKEIYIGVMPPKTGNWMHWYDEVLVDPEPTSYDVYSLSRLISRVYFPDIANQIDDLRNSFDAALRTYCGQRNCDVPGIDPPFPPNVIVEVNKMPLMYNHKSGPTTNFEDSQPSRPLMNAKRVVMNFVSMLSHNELIDYLAGMRFDLSDSFATSFTPLRGIVGDRPGYPTKDWFVPEGEYITKIETHWSPIWDSLSGIQFFTNRDKSPFFGYADPDGKSQLHNLNGDNLVGIRGNFTNFGLESFGFICTKLVF